MKYHILLFISFVLFSACGNGTPEFNIEDWPETTWRMNNSDSSYQIERWIRMNDALLMGSTTLIGRNGMDTSILEEMRLSINEQDVFLVPLVTGQNDNKEVQFKLVEADGKRFVFENKEHDFPNRIIYDYKNKNLLQATIEGDINGDKKKETFIYERL